LLAGARRLVAVLAACVAASAAAAITRVAIDIPDALSVEFGSPPQRAVRLEMFIEGKEVKAVRVLPTARNPALAGWGARDVESTLALKGGRVEGAITANMLAAGRNEAMPWKCIVDAAWKDGTLQGRAECTMGNASMSGHAFDTTGEKLIAMKGGEGFVELLLPGAGAEAGVRVGVEFRDGKAVAAASFSPLVHPVWRRVDASALSLKRGRLSGKLAWPATEADEDLPAAEAREVALNLDLRNGAAAVDAKKRTSVATLAVTPVFPERAEVELAFDAPLAGGERWRRRAVARLELSGGTVATSAFLNGRAEPGWSGVTETLSLERPTGGFDGALEATVASATVQPGTYTVRFKSEIVGPWIVGTFESDLAGDPVGKGDFTGWFAPVSR
jgi:hypothetical protein